MTEIFRLHRSALWLTLAILCAGLTGPARAVAAQAQACQPQAAGAPCDPCSVDPSICQRPPLPPRCVERPDGPGCDPCGMDPSACKRPPPPTRCAKVGGCKPCWIESWLCHAPPEPAPKEPKDPDHPPTWLPNGSGGGIY